MVKIEQMLTSVNVVLRFSLYTENSNKNKNISVQLITESLVIVPKLFPLEKTA